MTIDVSRIAKAFQDYFLNLITQKFGATVFTEGLQHAMKLPYQEFEDARSGETLSILQKVRIDTEKFIAAFINILFPVIVGIAFVAVYASSIHWSLPLIYFGGIFLLTVISNLLSKKVKIIQRKIVGQTNALAGATTAVIRPARSPTWRNDCAPRIARSMPTSTTTWAAALPRTPSPCSQPSAASGRSAAATRSGR